MYYLIQKNGVYSIFEKPTPRNIDAEYSRIEKETLQNGGTIHGQFGRLDYATKWRDYYNTGGYEKNGVMKI